jgi:hypothetical protein
MLASVEKFLRTSSGTVEHPWKQLKNIIGNDLKTSLETI